MLNTEVKSLSPEENAVTEYIRIKARKLSFKFVTAKGKEGDHYVVVAPSIFVSGYGSNEQEARESFTENLDTFCEDIMGLSVEQRDNELRNLGFKKERFHNKNFSKAYVDENGVLQGIEPETLEISTLEATM